MQYHADPLTSGKDIQTASNLTRDVSDGFPARYYLADI
jgi:hypothetical protein